MYRIIDDGFRLIHHIKDVDIKPCKTLKDLGKRLHEITKSCHHPIVAAIRTKLKYYQNIDDIEEVFEKEIKPLLKPYHLTITKE